jgi:hypothetical protein
MATRICVAILVLNKKTSCASQVYNLFRQARFLCVSSRQDKIDLASQDIFFAFLWAVVSAVELFDGFYIPLQPKVAGKFLAVRSVHYNNYIIL